MTAQQAGAPLDSLFGAAGALRHPLWVVGDVHGALGKLRVLLYRAGLLNEADAWAGGSAHLVFLGDYLDRGEAGVGVIRFIRTLQRQAALQGGQVDALVGNHEMMFLAAMLFGQSDLQDQYGFQEYWLSNGGQRRDQQLIELGELAWLRSLPAMLRVGPWLMQHADSLMYLHLGRSTEAVNQAMQRQLLAASPASWREAMGAFSSRLAFAGAEGESNVRTSLETFGGQRLVHGHTPVNLLLGTAGEEPGAPLAYALNLCLAVDSAMAYVPGAGFITRLDDNGVAQVVTVPAGLQTF